eukprot:GGOE01009645.1.p1 GENE.GGOE01009645.1~~GGOE01009645.1.p1  ORF type:complete len:167 (+),score=5.57 GGOE01009645.1:320-820(+)
MWLSSGSVAQFLNCAFVAIGAPAPTCLSSNSPSSGPRCTALNTVCPQPQLMHFRPQCPGASEPPRIVQTPLMLPPAPRLPLRILPLCRFSSLVHFPAGDPPPVRPLCPLRYMFAYASIVTPPRFPVLPLLSCTGLSTSLCRPLSSIAFSPHGDAVCSSDGQPVGYH